MSIFKNITLALAAITIFAFNGSAQNLRGASNYNNQHSKLMAKQNKVKDQIKVKETQSYAGKLYEESEPEPDIYTEGWDSQLVNCYKESNVPNSKVINVRNCRMPVKSNYVTSHYGYRPKFKRVHKGVDLRAAVGDTVYSAFSGRVRLTRYERAGYGFYVIVRHENGLETVYGHLSRFLVKPDQVVKAGQPIALSGNTGHSTGPHLHFETRFMGYAINPEAIFDFAHRTTISDTYNFSKSTYTEARTNSQRASTTTTKSNSGTTTAQATTKKTSEKPTSTAKSREESRSTYQVKKGDSLTTIAKNNGISVAQLKKMNGIEGDNVQAGKVLRVK